MINQQALITKLLESPLARALEAEMNNGAEAVRKRAADDLAQLTTKHQKRQAELDAQARDAVAKRDRLRAQLEAAEREVEDSVFASRNERENFASRGAELRRLSTASAEFLREKGLVSA